MIHPSFTSQISRTRSHAPRATLRPGLITTAIEVELGNIHWTTPRSLLKPSVRRGAPWRRSVAGACSDVDSTGDIEHSLCSSRNELGPAASNPTPAVGAMGLPSDLQVLG